MGEVYLGNSRFALGEGSVGTMGSVTGAFTSESPLHPAAREVLLDAMDKGWADPTKLHRPSRELSILLDESRAVFGRHFQTPVHTIHFLGEVSLGYHLGISGFRQQSHGTFYYPATSRHEVLALATTMKSQLLPVDLEGRSDIPEGSTADLLAFANINGETGAHATDAGNFLGTTFIDATADPLTALPSRWDSALWDSRSWSGPAGLGIFALREESQWHNPLPRLDQLKVPGGFNPALAIASAVALDAHVAEHERTAQQNKSFNSQIRRFVTESIGDVDIASPQDAAAHLLSFSFLYVDAEQLIDRMERRGFSLDSGSACTSANLEPSHVLAAMGRLTHGNVRLTLHSETTEESVRSMLDALKSVIEELRSA